MSKPLINEYEAANADGRDITTEFGKLIETFLREKSCIYSTVELEYLLVGEITGLLSAIRLHKALKKKREMLKNA